MGGDWMAAMRPARSRSRPSLQQRSSNDDSRMCSRLLSGSASTPSRVSRLVAVVETRSCSRSSSSRIAGLGAASEPTIEIGTPAREPGV
jgi:hypothetical protein